MPSSGILRRVALVRTDVSEELSCSIIRVIYGQLSYVVPRSPILVTLNNEYFYLLRYNDM
jgi:hypothetical protein